MKTTDQQLPPGLPPLPPAPDGYDRWEYRGKGFKSESCVYAYCHDNDDEWQRLRSRKGIEGYCCGDMNCHYIEAVAAGQLAESNGKLAHDSAIECHTLRAKLAEAREALTHLDKTLESYGYASNSYARGTVIFKALTNLTL